MAPDPTQVREAVLAAKNRVEPGRVLKVVYLDEQGESVGEYASTQVAEDPWHSVKATGLVEPPYSLAQLVFLAEMHPVHSSALEQKTADIVGKGWDWVPVDEDRADEKEHEAMEEWFDALAPDEFDMREALHAVWLDFETTGWGMFECARDPQNVVKRIYPVPAHTVKAHRNGYALCQARDSRKVWFRRWGAVDKANKKVDVDAKTGSIVKVTTPANDLFVIKKPSRRSTWYGIPGYVSSIGWITLALAARDDNLFWFSNRREPRWAIVLTGMTEDTEIEEDLRRAFTVDMKQPYRNIIIPMSGAAKVDFQQLSDTKKDGSFANLSERADKEIMVAHRVPAERLANSTVGALGGNVASEANRVYKEGVVNPSQEFLDSRLNRFVEVEYAKAQGDASAAPGQPSTLRWRIQMDDLDIRTAREDLDQAVMEFHADLCTLREARAKMGKGPLMTPKKVPSVGADGNPITNPLTGEPVMETPVNDPNVETEEEESPYNDMLFSELPGTAKTLSPASTSILPGTGGLGEQAALKAATRTIEAASIETLRLARETHDRVHDREP